MELAGEDLGETGREGVGSCSCYGGTGVEKECG